jgi:putative transposase
MIDREHKLPIKRQAEVLSISRGTAYYKPRPVSEQDLLLMRKLDELHLNYPFAGSRMLRGLLRQQGVDAGRLHIGTLMKKMGIEAIYRKRNTSKPAPGHRIYPYLLRDLDGAWLRLSRRRGGLVQPQDPELEAVDHDGRFLLPRSSRRGAVQA